MRRNFRRFIEKNRWLKGVPNALTICNSLCGFAAIVNLLRIEPDKAHGPILSISACMILGAIVFDALDGFTARIFNAASMKGLQMDSLADMTTFGVAPAVLVAVIARNEAGTRFGKYFAFSLAAIYLAAAALRLAQYNTHAILEKKNSEKFHGLPSPAAAAAIAAAIILFQKFDQIEQLAKLLPVYAGMLGLLMISDIRYQHMGKWLESVRRNRARLIIALVILACFLAQPLPTAALAINLYVFFGVANTFSGRYRQWKEAKGRTTG